MSAPISPFAPALIAEPAAIEGARLATAAAGIRYSGRADLLLVRFDPAASVAGVFTRSRCASAPVEWCRAILPRGKARGLLVNSGNANAFTGIRGRKATEMTARAAAGELRCTARDIYLASTGVIGEPLDPAPFERHVASLAERASPGGFVDAARAIMTTDTFPKVATRSAAIGDATVTFTGIAKGAGMIAPDMATMLSFVFTDAAAHPALLQRALAAATRESFNAITVDSDTSTSDTLLLFATGAAAKAGAPVLGADDWRRARPLRDALTSLCADLAGQVVRDGEGLSKVAEIRVTGANSARSARRIAFSVANSPLVKTALAGEDANWGRVVMAVGKAGEPADRDRISIWFGEHRVAHRGERDPSYSEEAVSGYMKQEELLIAVDLGLGRGSARVLTCDLTAGYVAINADYRS